MRRHAALSVLTTGFLAALFLAAPLLADDRKTRPMVDPKIDAGPGPFCYFSRPTDQLRVMDGEHGFQVTAEGWLYTRRIEVVFMAGAVGHPQWWLVDLGRLRKVARVRIFFYAGDKRGYACAVLTSGDGIAWRTIAHHPDPVAATPEGEAVTVTPHPARYVKVVVLKNTANPAAHVAEVQVFGE